MTAILIHGLLLATLQQPGARPASLRMPFGTYDYFGHVAWGELGTISSEAARALRLYRSGKIVESEAVLWSRFQANPGDLTTVQGLVASNRALSRTVSCLNRIALLADQHAPSKTSLDIVFAYQYGLGTYSEAQNADEDGTTFNPANPRTPEGWVYSWFEGNKAVFRPSNRINAVMYVSLLIARGEIRDSRRAALQALKADPKFYQLRAVYAHSLASGAVAYSKGNGKWTEAPPEERSNIDEAFRQSKIVIQQAPQWPVGYYLAGFFGREKNKKEAIQYLKKYLEIGPKGTRRYKDSEAMLAELKRAK